MKKIAILSLVLDNYGTKLQSFALYRTLKEMCPIDVSIEVINIEFKWRGEGSKVNRKKQIVDVFKGYGVHSFSRFAEITKWMIQKKKYNGLQDTKLLAERHSKFNNLNTLIPYTEKCYTLDDIRQGKLPQYDMIIVGSDQVWNDIKVGNQDVFMLDFPHKGKSMTYAASFGMTSIPSNMFASYKKRIENFDLLLIREEEGIELCKQLGRNDAKLVVDPTLLLRKDEYFPIINKRIIEEDYILMYTLNSSLKIYDQAYKVAKKNNWKLVILKAAICPPDTTKYDNAIELFSTSPEDFLSLVDNAKYVITNSYHAFLFSINFETDFYLYLDNADEENSRMLTLCRKLGLEDRISWMSGTLPQMLTSVDYGKVRGKLFNLVDYSLKCLKEVVDKL